MLFCPSLPRLKHGSQFCCGEDVIFLFFLSGKGGGGECGGGRAGGGGKMAFIGILS